MGKQSLVWLNRLRLPRLKRWPEDDADTTAAMYDQLAAAGSGVEVIQQRVEQNKVAIPSW